jgi:glycine/D-amino acid oxidase-like deaminating enzyme
MKHADVVICGAGIAGISTAYYLTVKQGIKDVVLVDYRPPLTLTSDKSTECYRNWWPGPGDTMVRFMNRSIDLLEELADESDNYFGLNRRGYVFLTSDPERISVFTKLSEEISALGAGPVRYHDESISDYHHAPLEGYRDQPVGADILIGSDLIRRQFPFISEEVVAMLNPRRCGWLSAQQLGMYLLEKAKASGARLINGRVTSVDIVDGKITGVHITGAESSERIDTKLFVNAAGPMIAEIGRMMNIELPVFNELHGKISFTDSLSVIPRDAPMMIWSDPVILPWTKEEKADLAAYDDTRWLTGEFPSGVHFRPEGLGESPIVLMLWTYDLAHQEPVWPPTFDRAYPEIVLRGLSRMVPGLAAYFTRMGKPWIDGGYYCKTQENRPLIGPLPVNGAYIIGALSGYGIMASQAAGELMAQYIAGGDVPEYAPDFRLERYEDRAYKALLTQWDPATGQL